MSSSVFGRYLCFFTQVARRKVNQIKNVDIKMMPKLKVLPYTVGFSIFTWLGFDKKETGEDEIVKTIKHSILFIQKTEYERAENLLHVALRQAQQIQHQLGITYIYDVMANLALERHQLDKSKQLFIAVSQRLMSNGVKESDPRIVHISIKLARISHLQKQHEVAQLGYEWCLEKLKSSLEANPDDELKKLTAIAKDWYGRLFLDTNQIEHAYNLMLDALNLMSEIPDIDTEQIVQQLNDLGTVCEQIGRLDESINFFKEAINASKQIQDYDHLGIMYVNLGRAYLKKNMITEARKSCGYAWRLGADAKNQDIKKEAESCLKQVQSLS